MTQTHQFRKRKGCSAALDDSLMSAHLHTLKGCSTRKDIRAIPTTAQIFFTTNTCCRITATTKSCVMQRSAAITSEVPMRSRSIWEIAELNATKTRPKPTCDQLRYETGFGGEGCIDLRFLLRIEERENCEDLGFESKWYW